MFSVDHGHLTLKDMVIRGGFTANTTDENDKIGDVERSGGGVFAVNSTVSVTRCEFNDNYAQHLGGGIFVNASTLHVFDSIFRFCKAGYVATIVEPDVPGAGGGINADLSEVLIDSCLFEGGYAQNKGAGISHGNGNMSVLRSVFYNNTAGGNNIDSEEPTGEGADLAFTACDRSFNSLRACDVNDTVFVNSRVAKKGGAVAISNGEELSSEVEFNRCTVDNSSTGGLAMMDDPQGEGGAFVVGDGVTLLLSNCTLKNNYCGKKGGALVLSNGEAEFPGAHVIMQNSYFQNNTAGDDNGGVVNVGEFCTLSIEGDGNVFERNSCGQDGGVLATTTDTVVTIEGGTFEDNECGENGGVIWSKGKINIGGGSFVENESRENGGVLHASENSVFTVTGGTFEDNRSGDGAVAEVGENASLHVEGGTFSGNFAEEAGGVFNVLDGGVIEITGGTFRNNTADYGGFLYAKGGSKASCKEVSILNNTAVEGGAIYVLDDTTLDWACDIGNNSAIAGPAIYARDGSTVKLTGISLYDNTAARGSMVFVVRSVLETSQVKFINFSASVELSAVQVDQSSSFTGDHTSFIGFEGEAVIFSEGDLYLDDCDFSHSNSSVLVYSEPGSIAVIRNANLGDQIYLALAEASSNAGELPSAMSLTNANVKCGDPLDGRAGGGESMTSGATYSLCSPDTECRDGDLGVYCQCYYTEQSNREERCVSGDAAALNLTAGRDQEGETFYPDLLERSLSLSYKSAVISSVTSVSSRSGSSSSSDKIGNGEGGVVWQVNAAGKEPTANSSQHGRGELNWVIFPSTGLLFPGDSITITVVTRADTYFDGIEKVNFEVTGIDADFKHETSSVSRETTTGETGNVASFTVVFYHCDVGMFWDRADSSPTSSGEYDGTCQLCSGDGDSESEGLNCSMPGATLERLPIKRGYWRAATNLTHSRACFNAAACGGGTLVTEPNDYCAEGYEGVVCSVCSSGYGRGAANQCHVCSESFKGGVFFMLSLAMLAALVVAALLAVYLVGGRRAVSSTVANTKQSVIQLQRRSADLLSRSERSGGVSDFSGSAAGPSGSSGSKLNRLRRIGGKPTVRGDGGSIGQEPPGHGCTGGAWERSGASNVDDSQPVFSRAYGGPSPPPKDGEFADVTNVGFPPIYEKFLSIVGVFSLDLGWVLSATCVAAGVGFYAKLLIVTIGPFTLLSLLAVTFHIGSRPVRPRVETLDDLSNGVNHGGTLGSRTSAVVDDGPSAPTNNSDVPDTQSGAVTAEGRGSCEGRDHLWELFARHTTMTLIILYLIYSQVSTVVFQTFGCDDYYEIHEQRLRADGRIDCETATHARRTWSTPASWSASVNPFGIPAAFLFMLLKQRSAINPPIDKSLEKEKGKQYVVQKQINQRANDESVAPTSFLWGAYYPSCYYFEVFECIRRLLLTGLLVFVSNSSEQVAYGCIFAFISLVLFEIQMPHIDALEIQLYRTGCLVIFFTNFLALIIQSDLADETSTGSAVYSVLLILVHVFFVLSICWNSWATMKATFSRRHVQGVVLGVDLVDEEDADKILGPEKAKDDEKEGGNKTVDETKGDDEEQLPAWQDKPAVPEFHFDSRSSGSVTRSGIDNPDEKSGASTDPVPDADAGGSGSVTGSCILPTRLKVDVSGGGGGGGGGVASICDRPRSEQRKDMDFDNGETTCCHRYQK
eukprot:jgi/Undpi1/6869/HiC_scaffold_21.g09345.m1